MTISFLRTRRRKAVSVGVGNYVPILGSPYQQYRAFVHSRHIIVKGTELRQQQAGGGAHPRGWHGNATLRCSKTKSAEPCRGHPIWSLQASWNWRLKRKSGLRILQNAAPQRRNTNGARQ